VLADGLLESQQRVAAVPGQLHVREHQHVEPHSLSIEQGDPAADDAELLQPTHPSPASGRRQPQPLGYLRSGQIAVVLQDVQDAQIAPV
jgi:hypothetical protein